MMSHSESAAARPVADQMQFNPEAAAEKDESMVSSLLNAVAGLAGEKGEKISLLNRHRRKAKEANPLLDDADTFAEAPREQPAKLLEAAAATMKETSAPVAAPKKENSYLAGLDLTDDGPAEPTPAKQHVSKPD